MMQQAADFLAESEALYALLAGLPDRDFEQTTAFKGWTINNILGHLHMWNRAADLSLTDGEAFYYISQTASRSFAYQRATVQDRRILVVYLDDNGQVREIAEYGMKDGKVFDYLARRTPTSGSDLAFISQILGGLMSPSL